MPNNQPAQKFRLGYVTATVWENNAEGRAYFSVNLSKSYKDSDGNWKETDALGAGDLLNASKVLERAEEWIATL